MGGNGNGSGGGGGMTRSLGIGSKGNVGWEMMGIGGGREEEDGSGNEMKTSSFPVEAVAAVLVGAALTS